VSVLAAARPAERPVIVGLCGRQNAGKTSLLMHLTGTAQRPVNFPGSSVERTEAGMEVDGRALTVVDLPGLASLVPVSRDEEIALEYLRAGRADVLCAVIDASKLSVELHFLKLLSTLGKPLVVALNKADVARAEGRAVDPAALRTLLGVPLVETNALAGSGMVELGRALASATGGPAPSPFAIDPDQAARSVSTASSPRASLTDRLDGVLLHRWWGLPILVSVVLGIFQLIFVGAEPLMGLIEDGQALIGAWIRGVVAPGALQSLLVDGVVTGVGSIVVFLPQIVILLALVALLEASGYMARAAFLLDRLLSGVGLNGRSFVPLVSSFACAVPGILATRIIENERDRIATIVVAPLMSCSARLPVYVLLIGAFFPPALAGLVLFGMYALGIVLAAVVALLLRRTLLRGRRSPLLMELPVYQQPSGRVVARQVWSGTRDFIVMAGTVIFATSMLIWLLSYYPRPAAIHASYEHARSQVAGAAEIASLEAAERTAYLEQSYLASAGKAIQPIFAPAGFDWRTSLGVLAAFPARELIIPTLGVLYGAGETDPGRYDLASLSAGAEEGGLRQRLIEARGSDQRPVFDPVVALALMVFFALCSQCASTLGAIRRETRSWKWPAFTFAYMTSLAWVGAVLTYQIGSAVGG
jgi:ferrous iron transport protein B